MKRAVIVIAALVGDAAADVRIPSPREVREPLPRHLRMRPRAAQVAPKQPVRPATPMPRAPSVSATSNEPIAALDGLRDVRQPVSFTLSLGYQIEGSRPSGAAGHASPAPVPDLDFSELRSYGFGEAFVSSRGIGMKRLETYFALRFQAARRLETSANEPLAAPIATWFERSGGELRTGWGEMTDFLPKRFGLSKLRVRAGDQFIYGPWVMHLSGLNVAYEGKLVGASLYGGQRRADYARDLVNNQPGAYGTSLRFDLRGLTDKVPIVVAGDFMHLNASEPLKQPATDTSQLQLDWRPRRDVAVIGQLRWLDGEPAHRRVEIRTRYKDVTNIVVDFSQRFATDWRWDPTLVQRSDDITEAKRYLDLGPVLPQFMMSARGGTLIAENVDLFARLGGAIDATTNDQQTSSFNASYFEAAGGLEVRLRRQVALGLSGLTRQTRRDDPTMKILDQRTAAQPLPETTLLGDDGFVELGTTVRLTLGARRFSALVEIYGRRTRFVPIYEDPLLEVPDADVRGGGRLSLDAWLGKRARVSVSYDASSALDSAPEITGYKSLRLVMTGVY